MNQDDEILALKEENKRLRKDNYSINEKLKKMESGSFDEFFTYSTREVVLPAKGPPARFEVPAVEPNIVTIKITTEADFYLTKMVRTGRAFKFLIRDSSNDRQWSNVALDARLGAGSAGLPLILPKPRFIARGSTIVVELTNDLDIPNPVSLGFVGYKVYH